MNQQSLTMSAIVGVVAGVIAFGIYEVIAKLTKVGFKHGLPTAAIVGVVTLVVAFGISYFITQSRTKKPA